MSSLAQVERLPAGLGSVELLREQRVRRGERWVYSAGFNVVDPNRDGGRLKAELEDLDYLASGGARVAVLSHWGKFGKAGDHSLRKVAAWLQDRLGRDVGYFPELASQRARVRARGLEPGELVLFGNTRSLPGEEANDPWLARRFAALGDRVAIGGFSKAHREHASNAGILDYLPGYLAQSLVREFELLAPWRQGTAAGLSVAAIGGVKAEKVAAFERLAGSCDVLVPGGSVLNALLRTRGRRIGASALPEADAAVARLAAVLEREGPARIHLPRTVVVAPLDRPAATEAVAVADGVPDGFAIVDFALEPWLCELLAAMAEGGGRILVAGPPALCGHGYSLAVRPLLRAASAPAVESLLVGGDTAAELPWSGPASAGGGSALHYLIHGECPVVEVLAAKTRTRTGR
ncbi:MAG: phosphoglycerate kinase [Solirubrobacterales bacterium]